MDHPNSTQLENTPLRLVRDNMEQIPIWKLPQGYRFRTFREGDEQVWLSLHISGEPFVEMTPELFDKQFGDGGDVLSERMYFVETDAGIPVGSITAWWDKNRYGVDERGRIHWVIVHPEHRRRGIAKAMMTRAMQTLAEHHNRAMLDTSSGRPTALKIYLDFGFVPDPSELGDRVVLMAWRRVQDEIAHPVLGQVLLNAPIDVALPYDD